jgi:hypothetical protein
VLRYWPVRTEAMQDAVSGLLRILLLRARMNKGYKKRRKSGACDKPRSSATIGALECLWFSSGSLVVYLEEPHLPL